MTNIEEIEKSVLGAVLIDGNLFEDIVTVLQNADNFSFAPYREVFSIMYNLYQAGEFIDVFSIERAAVLNKTTLITNEVLVDCADNAASLLSAVSRASVIREHARKRHILLAAQEILSNKDSLQVEDIVGKIEEAVGNTEPSGQIIPSSKVITEILNRIISGTPIIEGGLATGYTYIDALLQGLRPETFNILAARPAMGKAQPVDTPVCTPNGFVPIGSLEVGDFVIGADGKPTQVIAVHKRGVLPTYKIIFNNNTYTHCCGDHLWQTDKGILDTKTIALGKDNYSIPVVVPVDYREKPLPVDPYVLGGLIASEDNLPLLNNNRQTLFDSLPNSLDGQRETFIDTLEGIENSFIPDTYLYGSIEQRVKLLQGLMDSKGWLETEDKDGIHTEEYYAVFSSSSPQLIVDIQKLIRSLGGVIFQGWSNCILFTLPKDIIPFRTKSDLKTWINRDKQESKCYISNIETANEAECVCITVKAPDGLYVTENYIVTHNSALAANIAYNMGVNNDCKVLFVSLEMSVKEILGRIVSAQSSVPFRQIQQSALSPPQIEAVSVIAKKINNSNLFFTDNFVSTLIDIRQAARQMQRSIGLDIIIIDYIQQITGGRNHDRRVVVDEISRGCKIMSRQLQVPVLGLAQLSRALESRPDKRPMLSDLRESGSLEQDADSVLFIYRDEVYNEDSPDAGTAEIIIAKNRNGPTGLIRLDWNPELLLFDNRSNGFGAIPAKTNEMNQNDEYERGVFANNIFDYVAEEHSVFIDKDDDPFSIDDDEW